MYILAAAVVLALVYYLLLILPSQWVKVERVSHPMGLNKKVFQISDLHVDMVRVSPRRLQRMIVQEKPDYIFLTGDYVQSLLYLGRVDRYMKALQETGIPAYAVLGNHDYRLRGDLPKLLHLLECRGIHVLRNDSVALDGFRLVGIDDADSRMSDVRAAFRKVRERDVTVVIAHDPNLVLKIHRPFGYLMAGHLHGGQLRLPFVFRYVHKGILPQRGIVKGYHSSENGAFYISRGIGQVGVNVRFLMRSEVTVHEL